jgi:hypothetical protein
MTGIFDSLLELMRDPSQAKVSYYAGLANQIASGKSTQPVTDMIRLSGFPFQLFYRSQELRNDN